MDQGKVTISVNGLVCTSDRFDPEEVFTNLLCCFSNLDLWPFHSLVELFNGLLDIVVEYCFSISDQVKGKRKAAVTRFVNSVEKRKIDVSLFDQEKDSRFFVLKRIYNQILRTEGLNVLHGFGMTNRYGDTVFGNPEIKSIYS